MRVRGKKAQKPWFMKERSHKYSDLVEDKIFQHIFPQDLQAQMITSHTWDLRY